MENQGTFISELHSRLEYTPLHLADHDGLAASGAQWIQSLAKIDEMLSCMTKFSVYYKYYK